MLCRPSTISSVMMYLPPCSWSGRRYIRSSIISSTTARKAPGARVALQRPLGDHLQSAGREFQFASFHPEESLELLHQRIFRLGQDVDQRLHVQLLKRGDNGQSADELGNHSELDEIFRLNLRQNPRTVAGCFSDGRLAVESDLPLAKPLADDVFQSDECSAADEQNLRRVHLDVLLLGMFSSALGRNVGDGSLEHLQQRLLDALAGNVARDADVVLGFSDFVDLVDVNDAALGGFQIVIRVLQQLQENVFHVLADVSRFGERGGIADGERHVKDSRQRLGQQRFPASGPTDQQDIALINFDIATGGAAGVGSPGAAGDSGAEVVNRL